jgi:ABC-type multidrug transport system ATPase subunit
MLQRLQKKGIAILVSTPYMDEAMLCDRVALIQNGKLLKIDTPQHIIQQFSKPMWAVKAKHMYRLIQDLRGFEGTDSCFAFGEYLHLTLQHGEADVDKLHAYLLPKKPEEFKMFPVQADIEDCFMELMKSEKVKSEARMPAAKK